MSAAPDWKDAQALKAWLATDGWRSPNTYCNYFGVLEDISAVYLLLLHKPEAKGWPGYDFAMVAYVGMSTRLKSRLATHDVIPKIETPDVHVMRWFKPTPTEALRETERHFIRHFNPPWNLVGKTRGVLVQ